MNKIINKLSRELGYQTGLYVGPPEFLSLIITFSCNFQCQSCAVWQKPNENEMNEADWKKIIGQLAKNLKPDAFVEINGGEPLIEKGLALFLIRELKKYFKKVALNSNGSLVDEGTFNQLKLAGLDLIKISFYGLNEKTHNILRGNDSAYRLAKRALELANQKQLALEIGLLITSLNIKEAPALITYLQKLPDTSIILQPLDERIESAESKNLTRTELPANLWPSASEVNEFFDWVSRHNQRIKNSGANIRAIRQYYLEPKNILRYRCFAGQRNLVVYPDGRVAFCFKTESLGNLKNQNLNNILKNGAAERRKTKKCEKYCRVVGCNFSRGFREFVQDELMNSPV